jgi:hypothetical protein
MQSVQLQLFDPPEQSFSPFKWMQGVSIDEVFCYIGKTLSAVIVLFGLMCVLNGAIQEAKREDKIEELIYRRNEDEELFDEATPNFTTYQKLTTSKAQKRMIVRSEIRKKWKRERMWRRAIEKQLR